MARSWWATSRPSNVRFVSGVCALSKNRCATPKSDQSEFAQPMRYNVYTPKKRLQSAQALFRTCPTRRPGHACCWLSLSITPLGTFARLYCLNLTCWSVSPVSYQHGPYLTAHPLALSCVDQIAPCCSTAGPGAQRPAPSFGAIVLHAPCPAEGNRVVVDVIH